MSVCREPLAGERLDKRRALYDTPDSPIPAQRAGLNARAGGARHPFRTKPERKPASKESSGRANFSIEGYDILECRGKGGMGQVYRAVQKSLGREVAIKTLDLALARHEASIMRFTKEAAAMAHLRHPNIVQVIDRGSSRQRHYFIMEFVDGPCLRELLREGAFAPQESLQIMLQLARTMAYAHKQGVVHRDLKPENILYTSDGVLKVADFGLAGVAHETTHIRKLTRSFVSMGTECYMAPEQRRDAKNVDFRADIFSMGVIFYELLTNQLPFPQMPPPHVVIAPGFPQIDAIIRRSLEPKIEDRYTSTESLVSALEQALESLQEEPVVNNRDTVIDTPAVREKAAQYINAPSSEIEARVSGWSGRMQSAVSDMSSHVSMSWQQGSLRRWMWSGASILLLAVLVALAFWAFPSPPEPKATSKELRKLVWKYPAQSKTLGNNQSELSFSFTSKGQKGSWRRRPRQQWSLKGHWSAEGSVVTQNTYQKGAIINVRNRWAVYRGHQLRGTSMRIDAQLSMLAPMVQSGQNVVPLRQFIRESMPVLRKTKMYPRMGLGFQGERGQRAAFLLRRKGDRLAYTLLIRTSGASGLRAKRGFLRAPFAYNQPLRVSLRSSSAELSAWINGKQIQSIPLSQADHWPAFGGLICRDAHCTYRNLKMAATTQRNAS